MTEKQNNKPVDFDQYFKEETRYFIPADKWNRLVNQVLQPEGGYEIFWDTGNVEGENLEPMKNLAYFLEVKEDMTCFVENMDDLNWCLEERPGYDHTEDVAFFLFQRGAIKPGLYLIYE